MENELKERFKVIAEKDGSNFDMRVKSILQMEGAEADADSLRNFILMIPDFIRQIRVWMNDPQVLGKYKELHGFFLTYLYHEDDFLPDTNGGLFGYLDDAYMIGRVYEMTMRGQGFASRVSIIDSKTVKKDVPRWLKITQRVIPGETEKIDRMIDDILQGKPESFDQLMRGGHVAGK
jgi:hypothetical protein